MVYYDQSLCFDGKVAIQEVKLTFGLWEYRKEVVTTVGGNCLGLNVIRAAVENVYDNLKIRTQGKYGIMEGIILEDSNGNSLETFDVEQEGCQWLENMLISAEIISINPSGK